jgi:stage V sporulation protein AC
MKITKKEYQKYVEQKAKKSPIIKNICMAFLFGGAICTVGQVFMNLYKNAGLDKEEVAAANAITMIFLGALLTGLNIYDNMAKHAGAGTIVPITGFANSIVSPAMEFKSEGFILGMGAKMFVIAGPVLVFGTAASVVYGLILYIFRLV